MFRRDLKDVEVHIIHGCKQQRPDSLFKRRNLLKNIR